MNKPLKILVVEDEILIATDIAQTLEELGYEVSGILPKGEPSLAHIKEEQPDLILLDIMLKGKWNGIETARQIQTQSDVPIIFLTSNGDRGTFTEAKAVRPAAFLTKPFHTDELERAIELAVLSKTPSSAPSPPVPLPETTFQVLDDRIFIKDKDLLIKVPITDISYIQAESNYCRIVTTHKSYLLAQTLKNVAQSLAGTPFLRVHRSYLINLVHLEQVGSLFLLVAGQQIPIAKSYRPELMEKIQAL